MNGPLLHRVFRYTGETPDEVLILIQSNDFGYLFFQEAKETRDFVYECFVVWSSKKFNHARESGQLTELSPTEFKKHYPTSPAIRKNPYQNIIKNPIGNYFALPKDQEEELDLIEIEEKAFPHCVPPRKYRNVSAIHWVCPNKHLSPWLFHWNASHQRWENLPLIPSPNEVEFSVHQIDLSETLYAGPFYPTQVALPL